MIIDSHQHVFWHKRDDVGLIRDLDEHGISTAWLLAWEIPPHEDNRRYHGVLDPRHARSDGTHAGIPLSAIVATRDRYPDRFILGYAPYPGFGNAAELFECAYHIHGVRVCGEWKFRILFDDPRCIELYRKAGELGCPVVLHLDIPFLMDRESGRKLYQPLWYGGTVDNLERALAACPDTIFVGHAPGFWREISAGVEDDPDIYPTSPVKSGGKLYRLFDEYPNLYADLSAGSGLGALRRDVDHAHAFVHRYADRLLFGRDCYGGEHLEFLNSLNLDARDRTRIMGENARRLIPPS